MEKFKVTINYLAVLVYLPSVLFSSAWPYPNVSTGKWLNSGQIFQHIAENGVSVTIGENSSLSYNAIGIWQSVCTATF